MKVKELIEKLSELNQDEDIFIADAQKPFEYIHDIKYVFGVFPNNNSIEHAIAIVPLEENKLIYGGFSLKR